MRRYTLDDFLGTIARRWAIAVGVAIILIGLVTIPAIREDIAEPDYTSQAVILIAEPRQIQVNDELVEIPDLRLAWTIARSVVESEPVAESAARKAGVEPSDISISSPQQNDPYDNSPMSLPMIYLDVTAREPEIAHQSAVGAIEETISILTTEFSFSDVSVYQEATLPDRVEQEVPGLVEKLPKKKMTAVAILGFFGTLLVAAGLEILRPRIRSRRDASAMTGRPTAGTLKMTSDALAHRVQLEELISMINMSFATDGRVVVTGFSDRDQAHRVADALKKHDDLRSEVAFVEALGSHPLNTRDLRPDDALLLVAKENASSATEIERTLRLVEAAGITDSAIVYTY
ncbi:MAG: hypothetical protein Q4P05_05880 [Actinomycetaceae bacterium]|nr:hypothetical protein [Actinomycetaceae bacterium]